MQKINNIVQLMQICNNIEREIECSWFDIVSNVIGCTQKQNQFLCPIFGDILKKIAVTEKTKSAVFI